MGSSYVTASARIPTRSAVTGMRTVRLGPRMERVLWASVPGDVRSRSGGPPSPGSPEVRRYPCCLTCFWGTDTVSACDFSGIYWIRTHVLFISWWGLSFSWFWNIKMYFHFSHKSTVQWRFFVLLKDCRMWLFYAGSGDVCPNHLSQENTHSRGQGSPRCICDPKVTGYTRPQGHSSERRRAWHGAWELHRLGLRRTDDLAGNLSTFGDTFGMKASLASNKNWAIFQYFG